MTPSDAVLRSFTARREQLQRSVLFAAVLIAGGACGPPTAIGGPVPEPTPVLVRGVDYRGVVFPGSVPLEIARRTDASTTEWTPTTAQVLQFEQGISDYLPSEYPQLFSADHPLSAYVRQYRGACEYYPGQLRPRLETRVPGESSCMLLVQFLAWPPLRWKMQRVEASDGGIQSFQVRMDVDTGRYFPPSELDRAARIRRTPETGLPR